MYVARGGRVVQVCREWIWYVGTSNGDSCTLLLEKVFFEDYYLRLKTKKKTIKSFLSIKDSFFVLPGWNLNTGVEDKYF